MDLVEKYSKLHLWRLTSAKILTILCVVVAGVVYGDPSHNITAPFNKGTAKTNGVRKTSKPSKTLVLLRTSS